MNASPTHRRSGIAALWSLVIVTVITMMSATAMWQFTAARRMLERREHAVQAQWLARSGAELAAARLILNADYKGESLALLPDSELRITTDKVGDGEFRIRSEARFPLGEQSIITKVIDAKAARRGSPPRVQLEMVLGEVIVQPMRVTIETDLGDIEIELYPDRAPATVANFLRYVDANMYDGGRFHLTVTLDNQPNSPVKIEVIQAGVHPDRAKDEFPAIKLERTSETNLRHTDGTLSMARDGPDTATGDFFICIGDQPELDFGGQRNPDGQGFAAFGRVIRGMEVVKRIQISPAKEQSLAPPVSIKTVRRVTEGKN